MRTHGMSDAAYAQREGRVAVVLHLVTAAAEKGGLCPSNTAISSAIGTDSPSSSANYIRILENRGQIEVQRYASFRVVRIVATGKQTAMPEHFSREPHWRDRDKLRPDLAALRTKRLPGEAAPLIDIGARIERDQARLRSNREQWLDREVSRYGLTKRGRFIDEMVA